MTISVPKALPIFRGYPVNFYAERLSDFDVEHSIPQLIEFCLIGCQPSELLAAYFGAVQSFEQLRRGAIENGCTIIEAMLPTIPAHHWNGAELGNALVKAIGVSSLTSGPIGDMCRHILNCLVAETQFRLKLIV